MAETGPVGTIKINPVIDVCVPITPTSTPEERIATFDALYEENKERIRMKKPVNYPINYKMGIKWAGRHCDVESAKFAEAIVSNTSYVSFADFMAALERVCASFKAHYKADKAAAFVLILPFNMTKSNIWVSLLAWPWLKALVTDVAFDITSVYNRYVADAKTAARRRVVCIICDDCAYTGNQLMGYCTLRASYVHYAGKPKEPSPNTLEWIKWNQQVTSRTAEIEAGLDPKDFSVNLLIPYMSTHAQTNIAESRFMLVPRDVQIFKPFRERVDMYAFNQSVIREFETTFQYHTNISAIYFDHKIADAVSTFNKVYLLAPVFGCGNLRQSLCFIDGCCRMKDVPADINIYDVYMNLEDVLRDKTCPPTFYKSIKYTFGGRPISDMCTQELFARRRAAPGRSRR